MKKSLSIGCLTICLAIPVLAIVFGLVIFRMSEIMGGGQIAPNTRFYSAEGIRLSGPLGRSPFHYITVEIGTEGNPYTGSIPILIRCGDAELALDQATEQEVAALATMKQAERSPDVGNRVESKYIFCNFTIVFVDGVMLRAYSYGAGNHGIASIRTPSSADWESLPLSEEAVARLFGAAGRAVDTFVH
jgi:hypothetical protein